MRDKADFTALCWPDGRPKIAPVQGYVRGIPWSLHLKAYDAYRKKWGAQEALIDLEGSYCRGGFAVEELDDFVPGWRDEVDEIARLRTALFAYRYARMWLGADSFDGIDPRGIALLNHADRLAADLVPEPKGGEIGAVPETAGRNGSRSGDEIADSADYAKAQVTLIRETLKLSPIHSPAAAVRVLYEEGREAFEATRGDVN